jgi:uncharacterized protein YeaO (DUF488 family)
MSVKTGRASKSGFHVDNPRPSESGTVILITRGPPRKWVDKDEYIKILSPLSHTKNRWLASKKSEADKKRYLNDFLPKMKQAQELKVIEELRQRVKDGETITLLCYCEMGVFCHRDIITSMIEGM